MIEGEIREADGIVSLHIEATVTIAGRSGRVEFLIDTGAHATVLYPEDQAPFRGGIAAARQSAPMVVAEGVGGVATFRRISGTLAFDDREIAGQWEYRTDIYVAEPDGENDQSPEFPSLLGMDILRHWIPQGISPSRPAVLFAPKSP